MLLSALIFLAIGHFFTEFTLQKTRLGLFKKSSLLGLLTHAFLWTLALSPGIFLLSSFVIWKTVFLFTSHALIDFFKMRLCNIKLKITHPVNVIDQALHFLTVAIVLLVKE